LVKPLIISAWMVALLTVDPAATDSEPTPASTRGEAILATAHAEFSRVAAADATAWADAVAASAESGEPYAAAYARWRLAEALLAGREGRAEAGSALRQAFEAATELGAGPLAAEIEALATRARLALDVASSEESPPIPRAGSELGLSEREIEVLTLVAQGRTNRQIADELFITEKTAGHHVSNILSKLGVANRLAAASIAHRSGLVEPRPKE